MNFVFLRYLIPILFVSVCNGYRRIVGGHNTTRSHSFMAYLLKAEVDPSGYVDWMCGGTIVGKKTILTSAACVQDVKHLYAVTGTNKYDPSGKDSTDECVIKSIRKVVHICVPKAYDLVYEELGKWSNYDIALVKVDQDLLVPNMPHCSFQPEPLKINYFDESLQSVKTEAMVLGWGHKQRWGNEHEVHDGNSRLLRYAATFIYDKETCIKRYKSLGMNDIIKKYMICTWGKASFNDRGDIVDAGNTKDGCDDAMISSSGEGSDSPSDEAPPKVRYKLQRTEATTPSVEVGICQNDHGGPLISWKRGQAVVIGVASVFQMNKTYCHGPYLFTSTFCSSAFLRCVMENFEPTSSHTRRRAMPDYCYLSAKEKGFEIIERSISWLTVNNKTEEEKLDEKFFLRPQIPLASPSPS